MKLLILAVTVLIGGCSCCSEPTQYETLPPTVTVTDRYVHLPEILVDGATAELTDEEGFGWTFSDVFMDSVTGKKIEVSGVIPFSKSPKKLLEIDSNKNIVHPKTIAFTFRVPKDSVRVQDSSKVVTLKPIPPNLAWWEKIPRYVIAIIVGLIILLIVYGIVRKK